MKLPFWPKLNEVFNGLMLRKKGEAHDENCVVSAEKWLQLLQVPSLQVLALRLPKIMFATSRKKKLGRKKEIFEIAKL